jgi:hypothetical protein
MGRPAGWMKQLTGREAAEGASERVRQIKIARDTALKARSATLIAVKTHLVNAPRRIRERLEPLSDRALIAACAEHETAAVVTPVDSVMHAVRAMARRRRFLHEEIPSHDTLLDELTAAAAPTLRAAFGIGVDAAAELLIVAGDNPGRIRSEGAFAKLCGACPNPFRGRLCEALRGLSDSLLEWGNPPPAALSRWTSAGEPVPVPSRDRQTALASRDHRLCGTTNSRRTIKARHYLLPEALRRPRNLPWTPD